MNIDTKGWDTVVRELKGAGWTGSCKDLQQALTQAEADTAIRLMEQQWAWGARAKAMVFSLIACAYRRNGTVSVSNSIDFGRRGPHITLSFPSGSRLEALQMQVKGLDQVYVVRRLNGDWRSCRNFQLSNP